MRASTRSGRCAPGFCELLFPEVVVWAALMALFVLTFSDYSTR
ncbi:hypothetical protein J2R99_002108 [Rhodopseudomonas julia]|uniref:Uncharacterized protein n=1 Tax=Rhodopseudomonas julia TaxID=200617 RepID=A0ABU0C6X9_9BRAD|nr:hypothetical protein [Rhodopseudomonas julia]MDQ0326239.1 hypothetical protein [Rhodopseudomonas julia]